MRATWFLLLGLSACANRSGPPATVTASAAAVAACGTITRMVGGVPGTRLVRLRGAFQDPVHGRTEEDDPPPSDAYEVTVGCTPESSRLSARDVSAAAG
jgi:hypothetical protein